MKISSSCLAVVLSCVCTMAYPQDEDVVQLIKEKWPAIEGVQQEMMVDYLSAATKIVGERVEHGLVIDRLRLELTAWGDDLEVIPGPDVLREELMNSTAKRLADGIINYPTEEEINRIVKPGVYEKRRRSEILLNWVKNTEEFVISAMYRDLQMYPWMIALEQELARYDTASVPRETLQELEASALVRVVRAHLLTEIEFSMEKDIAEFEAIVRRPRNYKRTRWRSVLSKMDIEKRLRKAQAILVDSPVVLKPSMVYDLLNVLSACVKKPKSGLASLSEMLEYDKAEVGVHVRDGLFVDSNGEVQSGKGTAANKPGEN